MACTRQNSTISERTIRCMPTALISVRLEIKKELLNSRKENRFQQLKLGRSDKIKKYEKICKEYASGIVLRTCIYRMQKEAGENTGCS